MYIIPNYKNYSPIILLIGLLTPEISSLTSFLGRTMIKWVYVQKDSIKDYKLLYFIWRKAEGGKDVNKRKRLGENGMSDK